MIIYEGAADDASAEFEARTPLQTAPGRHAAALALSGSAGMVLPALSGSEPRPEVLLGCSLGLDFEEARTLRRGPVELRGLGLDAFEDSMVYRGNLVTMDEGRLTDSAVALSIDESESLVDTLRKENTDFNCEFHVLEAGRFLVVFKDLEETWPPGVAPFAVEGDLRADHIPGSKAYRHLSDFEDWSQRVLADHAVNEVRLDLGENPANRAWLWGGGRPVDAAVPFDGQGLRGCVLSNNALARGMARLCRLQHVDMADPFQLSDDGPAFDVPAVINALREADYLLVYAQAPREFGRFGGAADKVRLLEVLDFHVLGPVMTILDSFRPCRTFLTSCGIVSTATHQIKPGKLPFILAGAEVETDAVGHWDEVACTGGRWGDLPASRLFSLVWGEQ